MLFGMDVSFDLGAVFSAFAGGSVGWIAKDQLERRKKSLELAAESARERTERSKGAIATIGAFVTSLEAAESGDEYAVLLESDSYKKLGHLIDRGVVRSVAAADVRSVCLLLSRMPMVVRSSEGTVVSIGNLGGAGGRALDETDALAKKEQLIRALVAERERHIKLRDRRIRF